MPLIIRKIDDKYGAIATHPNDESVYWQTDKPVTIQCLVNQLLKQGWHPVDIADALSEMDSNWLQKFPNLIIS